MPCHDMAGTVLAQRLPSASRACVRGAEASRGRRYLPPAGSVILEPDLPMPRLMLLPVPAPILRSVEQKSFVRKRVHFSFSLFLFRHDVLPTRGPAVRLGRYQARQTDGTANLVFVGVVASDTTSLPVSLELSTLVCDPIAHGSASQREPNLQPHVDANVHTVCPCGSVLELHRTHSIAPIAAQRHRTARRIASL